MTLLDIILTFCTGGLWLIVVLIRGLNNSGKIAKELKRMRKKL